MRSNRVSGIIITIVAALAVPGAWAAAGGTKKTVNLDPSKGSIEFHATGRPSALKIVGKGSAPTGTFTIDGKNVTGTARFTLSSLDTGIDLRNRHMKEKYLEVGKYPDATLTVTRMTLPKALDGNASFESVPFSGKLLLHGVEHAVSGVARIEKKAGTVSVSAQFGLKIDDYKIRQPGFAGITMADDVQVVVLTAAPLQL